MASDKPREGPSHKEMAVLLSAYELGALSEEERESVESHVLQCDACFEELERGAAVAAELQANRTRYRNVLAAAPASALPRRAREARATGSFWSWLRPQIAVPALAAAAAVLVLVIRAPGPDYRGLATFPREEISSFAMRGEGGDDAVRELMQAGAGYFDLGRYDEAERRFAAALDRDPELAAAAYFLGLSRVLRGDVNGALSPLERAADIGGDNRLKYTWVLANAYLRAGRMAEARKTLRGLTAGQGEYAVAARGLLERLPE